MSDIKLVNLIKEIERNELLLPDFQRNFVWKEEMQRKLIASVLTKLPLGSLLLLESKSSDYRAKRIGLKTDIIDEGREVGIIPSYVLDGQQRLTVLVNSFSNNILRNVSDENELVHRGLQKRYFLRFKDLNDSFDRTSDLFGLYDLNFKYSETDDELPDFSSGEILDYIIGELIPIKDTTSPFNPKANLNDLEVRRRYVKACDRTNESGDFLIPLSLLGEDESLLSICIKELVTVRGNLLINYYNNAPNERLLNEKINDIFAWKNDYRKNSSKTEEFADFINECCDEWRRNFENYLTSCIKQLKLSIITMKSDERSRAIDIYENLNLGGISLSNFDLVLAVASISCNNFYSSFIDNLKTIYEVKADWASSEANLDDWSAFKYMDVFEEKKNNVSTKYIEVFLNLLSIVNNTNGLKAIDDLHMDFVKRERILSLKADQINNESKKVQDSINKALRFLQFKCGLVSISDLPYNHLLLGVSSMYYIFDELDLHQTNILESWYLSSIFSGEYDADQTPRIIRDIKYLSYALTKKDADSIKFINDRIGRVFEVKRFSDLDTLMLKDLDYKPKQVVKDCMMNFILAQGCTDFRYNEIFDLNAFKIAKEGIKIEEHHIIPLKDGVTTMADSAAKIRKDKDSIYNSPLNKTIISKAANNKILSDPISTYFSKIPESCIDNHLLMANIKQDTSIDDFLKDRFTRFKSRIKGHLTKLLGFINSGE